VRRLLFGGALLLCGVVASCSDATAPVGTLVIEVSPDTVRDPSQGVVPQLIAYTERYVGAGQPKIWLDIGPEVESEVTPGVWRTVAGFGSDPNNLYLQPALGDAWAAVTKDDLRAERSTYAPMTPGRYRLRQKFRLTAPSATEPAGEILEATSNVYVVMAP
jgi:hypothetical protein